MRMPHGLARALATLLLSNRWLSVLQLQEVADGERQPGLSSSPCGWLGPPRHPACAGTLRAPPAELQFDISRPARARLEPEHVPGCFIAAAAAAGAGRMCVCVRV